MSTVEAPEGEVVQMSARQLKFDGMPVAQHKVSITGTVTVTEEAIKGWKLGKAIELTIHGVVSSRKHKAQTNFGEPTGDVEHQLVVHVHDLGFDED